MYEVYRVSLEKFAREREGLSSRWSLEMKDGYHRSVGEGEREKEWTRPTNIVTRQRRIIDGLPSLWISRESRWRHKINRPSDKLKTSFLLNIHVARVPPLFPFFFFPCFGTHELAPRSRIYSLPRLVYLAATGEIDLPLEFVSSETARNELLVISCLEGREKSGPLGRRGIGSEIHRMNSFFLLFFFFWKFSLPLSEEGNGADELWAISRRGEEKKKLLWSRLIVPRAEPTIYLGVITSSVGNGLTRNAKRKLDIFSLSFFFRPLFFLSPTAINLTLPRYLSPSFFLYLEFFSFSQERRWRRKRIVPSKF